MHDHEHDVDDVVDDDVDDDDIDNDDVNDDEVDDYDANDDNHFQEHICTCGAHTVTLSGPATEEKS